MDQVSASLLRCSGCGFSLASLPLGGSISLEQEGAPGHIRLIGDALDLRCPLCGAGIRVALSTLGVFNLGNHTKPRLARFFSGDDSPAQLSVGRVEWHFEGDVEALTARDVCHASLPLFQDEKGEPVLPLLPLRAAFLGSLDMTALQAMLARGQQPCELMEGGREVTVRLPLRGVTGLTSLRLPVHSTAGRLRDLSLRLWPRADIEGFRFALATLLSTGPASEGWLRGAGRRLVVHAWLPGAGRWVEVEQSQRAGLTRTAWLPERPTWFAVELVDPAGRSEAGGLWSVPRQVVIPGGQAIFGIDFGTSNTCVATSGAMAPKGQPTLVPDFAGLHGSAGAEQEYYLYVLRGGREPIEHAGPELSPGVQGFGERRDVFSSELLFRREVSDGNLTERSPRFGLDYGLVAAGVRPGFDEQKFLVRGFKWRETFRRSHPGMMEHFTQVQNWYLQAVLLCSYVRCATASGQAAASVHVLYSYPLSFEPDDLQSLDEAMQMAVGQLGPLTGVNWSASRGPDEAEAAAVNAGDPGGNVFVYLDLGGGSTDIAIKVDHGQSADVRKTLVYATSLRYAGSDLLAAYRGIDPSRDDAPRDACLRDGVPPHLLDRRLREVRSCRDVLRDDTLFKPRWSRVLLRRTQAFYGYLVEYVARLLAAGILDQRFALPEPTGAGVVFPSRFRFVFFLLGNGWSFAQHVFEKDVRSHLERTILQRVLTLVGEAPGPYAEAIRMLLQNEPELGRGDLQDVPHLKSAVALGLLRSLAMPGATSAVAERAAIVGLDTRVGEHTIPWFARYSARDVGPSPPGVTQPAMSWRGSVTANAAGPLATPWYRAVSPGAKVNLPLHAPDFPLDLLSPFEPPDALGSVRNELQQECAFERNGGWFAKGSYEIILERMLRGRLREVC